MITFADAQEVELWRAAAAALAAARRQGAEKERAAIMAGLEHEIDARRRVGSPGVSMGTAQSWLDRLKAGEWSAKP